MPTYDSMAQELGVTKQTVRNWALRLDPEGRHVDRSKDVHVIDADLASMIAHKVASRRRPAAVPSETIAAVIEATDGERDATKAHFDEIIRLKDEGHALMLKAKDDQIADLKERLVELGRQLEREQHLLEQERRAHEETRRRLALAQALEGFKWPWQRREIMTRYALPSGDSGGEKTA